MARRSSQPAPAASAPSAQVRILVLYGPELMLRRERFETLCADLRQQHGPLDPTYFDGATAPLADVLDDLRTPSLLQSHKLVVVDNAAEFVKKHRPLLERYAQTPAESGTLVLRDETWHKGNLDKLILKVGAIVRCDPPGRAEAKAWVQRRIQKAYQRRITPKAVDVLLQRMGSELMLLDAELAKLASAAPDDQPIDEALVEQMVGRSSDEEAWIIQEAFLLALASTSARAVGSAPAAGSPGGRALAPVLEKLSDLVNLAGQSEVLVTYAVADLFRKLHLAARMRRQGVPEPKIAANLRLFGPRQYAFLKAAQKLNARSADYLFDQIIAADRRAKSGLGEPLPNLQAFCVLLADELSG
ncbi:MAG: hypothetical protein IT443_06170 [Phycisphaeraceae bacterium]|nr:hypothetical protein [Phycisphaeraceae bacterium]